MLAQVSDLGLLLLEDALHWGCLWPATLAAQAVNTNGLVTTPLLAQCWPGDATTATSESSISGFFVHFDPYQPGFHFSVHRFILIETMSIDHTIQV